MGVKRITALLLAALAGAERIFTVMEEKPEVDEGTVELVRVQEAPDGTLTELSQQMYCDARGTTPVNILDIQNGLVFLRRH